MSTQQFDPPSHLSENVARAWVDVVTAYGPGAERIIGPDLEAYCGQLALLRDAQRRVAAEGMIVADVKGNPIPHPAVMVERAAQEELRKWGNTFKRRATR